MTEATPSELGAALRSHRRDGPDREVLTTRPCEVCGTPITIYAEKPNQRFCTTPSTCRVKAWRMSKP